MPKVSINVRDSLVYVDGAGRQVNTLGTIMAAVDPDIAAVVWDGVAGTIYYTPAGRAKLKARLGPQDPDLGEEAISDFTRFQPVVDAWTAAAPPDPPLQPSAPPKEEQAEAYVGHVFHEALIEAIAEALGAQPLVFRASVKAKVVGRL